MDRSEQAFLAIMKAAIHGERCQDQGLTLEEWHKVFYMAQIHMVQPLVYDAVSDTAVVQNKTLPGMEIVRNRVRQQIMVQTLKTTEFLALYQRLTAAGIRPLVVKGLTCRMLYPKPDLRPSSDEDILIPEKQLAQVCAELEAFGMTVEIKGEQLAGSHELPYRKRDGVLYVELHKQLFPPLSEAYGSWNHLFKDAANRAIVREIQGAEICTMEPTDNLFYLICHAFKHFMHSGFGVRQVCDIVLYVQKYGMLIQWDRFWSNCCKIRAVQFAAAMLAIGEGYLGLDPVRAGCADYRTYQRVDETLMLDDLLHGGLYGDSSLSRKHSSNITLDAVVAGNRGKPVNASVWGTLFPRPSKLVQRYHYLKKHPYLVPVAWADRLIKYRKETKHMDNSDAMDAIWIGSRRVELFRIYDIID